MRRGRARSAAPLPAVQIMRIHDEASISGVRARAPGGRKGHAPRSAAVNARRVRSQPRARPVETWRGRWFASRVRRGVRDPVSSSPVLSVWPYIVAALANMLTTVEHTYARQSTAVVHSDCGRYLLSSRGIARYWGLCLFAVRIDDSSSVVTLGRRSCGGSMTPRLRRGFPALRLVVLLLLLLVVEIASAAPSALATAALTDAEPVLPDDVFCRPVRLLKVSASDAMDDGRATALYRVPTRSYAGVASTSFASSARQSSSPGSPKSAASGSAFNELDSMAALVCVDPPAEVQALGRAGTDFCIACSSPSSSLSSSSSLYARPKALKASIFSRRT